MRVHQNLSIKIGQELKEINYRITPKELGETFENICEKSIYSYTRQIAEGFITIKGGNRVGITGSCVIEDGKIKIINNISSLNFRIAKQIKDVSIPILKDVIDLPNNTIFNTIIVSPPGGGKTTILRDIIRQLATGIKEIKFLAINVGVVDERGEIAAMYKGIPQNDIGIKTDIMENVSKNIGIKMLIRSMAPKVIVADEIGKREDIEAIHYAVCSGCKGIFTAHGSTFEDISLNPIIHNLIETHTIDRLIFLDEKEKGKIKELYALNKKNGEYEKTGEKL